MAPGQDVTRNGGNLGTNAHIGHLVCRTYALGPPAGSAASGRWETPGRRPGRSAAGLRDGPRAGWSGAGGSRTGPGEPETGTDEDRLRRVRAGPVPPEPRN